ncbi:hypothetical protein FHD45_15385 [Escherichia coli]|nr:hypothetical protein [Escherichia coli]
MIFIKMIRQLTLLLPTKFEGGKKAKYQQCCGLQGKEIAKLLQLTTKIRYGAVGRIVTRRLWLMRHKQIL